MIMTTYLTEIIHQKRDVYKITLCFEGNFEQNVTEVVNRQKSARKQLCV